MTIQAQTVVPAAPLSSSHDIQAGLVYLANLDTRPVIYYDQPGPPRRVGNYGLFPALVRNMRPIAGELSLNREGFRLIRHASTVRDFYDAEEVSAVYYPEVAAVVKAATGASQAIVFDHTIRIEGNMEGQDTIHRAPVRLVHNDYTHESGPKRVRELVGQQEADRWLAGRVVEINLWRPIKGPVEQAPLALADASSLAPEDIVAVDLVYPERTGEIYHVVHRPGHRWFYAPDMTPDEAILIKGYDSETDGRARFTPHTAFDLPDTPADAAPRESIEVRVFASFA
jgi:hypothetical protein